MKNNRIGYLSWNSSCKRWCLYFFEYYVELQCGDCFYIKFENSVWKQVRIEMDVIDGTWHFVTSTGNLDIPSYQCKVKEIR